MWGSTVLNVMSKSTTFAAFQAHRRGAAPAWLWALAVVVFTLTSVQAATGGRETLWTHVPGAMVVTVGPGWVLGPAVGLRAGARRSAPVTR